MRSIRNACQGQGDSLYLQAEIRQRMTTDNYRQQSRIIDRENAQVSNRQRLFTPGGRAAYILLLLDYDGLLLDYNLDTRVETARNGTAPGIAFCISGGLPRFTYTVRDIARLRHKTEARRERT